MPPVSRLQGDATGPIEPIVSSSEQAGHRPYNPAQLVPASQRPVPHVDARGPRGGGRSRKGAPDLHS
jgi:hypothetical protein